MAGEQNELAVIGEKLPAEIQHPAEAELEYRRHLAFLDLMRRGREDLREQVLVLVRIVEYACRGVVLVDEMRKRGELVAASGGGAPPELRGVLTLRDVGLTDQRLSEWRSLYDHDALGFLRVALDENREATFKRASVNWLRQRVERIDRENATPEDWEPSYDYEIRHGDLRDCLGDLAGQVDAIVTDPPYGATALPEYDALAAVADELLTPDGVLVALVGQTHLGEYLTRLSRRLSYRWCGAYLTDGPATRVHARNVGTKWKPVLVFDRAGQRPFLTQDVFVSAAADKRLEGQIDGWGQSESGMADLVARLTRPGQLVVDPFLGGGTTAVVCHQLGRRFVGCDVDADAVATARQRITEL